MTRRKQVRFWRSCGLAAIAGLSALATDFDFQLPRGFPLPVVPAGNPMTVEKVELGRHLFYDPRLSVNATQSCASCHRQDLAFTDGRAQGVGATGEKHPRGAMSLVNVAFVPTLTWAHPKMPLLEDQALVPMFGTEPIEMGLKQPGERLLMELSADRKYQLLFPAAFPGSADPFTLDNVTKALASFERSIISMRSPYDRYRYGHQDDAISASAKRGEVLFFPVKRQGVSNATAAGTSADRSAMRAARRLMAIFKTPGSTTCRARPHTRNRIQASMTIRATAKMSESFGSPRCVTSPSPLLICTTAASRRSRK